jgi:Large ribosomal RNA subunit accumulation protein YceD
MTALHIPLKPARLNKKGEHFVGSLDAAQCAEVAAELGILSVQSLHWNLHARAWRKDGCSLTGHVAAEVEQACIVTLEPVRQSITETVDLRFLPEAKAKRSLRDNVEEIAAQDISLDAAPDDEPDFFSGDTLDVGPLIIEHAALGLDPYPRRQGAAFDDAMRAALNPDDESPLARALRQWTGKPQ